MESLVLAGRANGHVVDDLRYAVLGEEAGDQDVRLGPVDLFVDDSVGSRRTDTEVSALPLIQNRGEDARRIEMGETEPVDGAVHPDQRYCLQVSDDAIVLDRQVSHFPNIAHSDCQ